MGGGHEGDVVVPAGPGPAFEVVQAQAVLQFAVVVLDAPADLGQADQTQPLERHGDLDPVQTWLGRSEHQGTGAERQRRVARRNRGRLEGVVDDLSVPPPNTHRP